MALPGYKSIVVHGTKLPEKDRRSGGIIVYVRKNLFQNSAVQPVKVTQNYIWIKINREAFQLERDILYVPFTSHQEYRQLVLKMISSSGI